MQVQTPSPLVAIRNLKPGPTVFGDQASDMQARWEGAGDPAGLDVQWVPTSLLSHPQFVTAMNRGVFEVVDDTTPAQPRPPAATAGSDLTAQATEAIHRPEVNDIVVATCLGPGTREGTGCQTQVSIKQSDLDTTPPLCNSHSSMSTSFVKGEDNQWQRVVLADRVVATEAPQ